MSNSSNVENNDNLSSSSEWDEEWEEWDGSSPFWHHCVAGSTAGLMEHGLVYPLDTVRTHIQVCAACKPSQLSSSSPSASSTVANASRMYGNDALGAAAGRGARGPVLPQGMWQTMRYLMNAPAVAPSAAVAAAETPVPTATGMLRLFRGVQSVVLGCIPAHALYFSMYEAVKNGTLNSQGEVTTYGSLLSGAVATVGHDVIMAPLDTIKQRMQLGHYQGVFQAIRSMIKTEGAVSLYRSFPITLATNIPYGMVMVGTNEFVKKQLAGTTENGEPRKLTLTTTLVASSLAGLMASALTTPLDRIKTVLQVQQLAPCDYKVAVPSFNCKFEKEAAHKANKIGPVAKHGLQAVEQILEREGMMGFFRGVTPRILSHTPAAAISWTTYEVCKQQLQAHF